MRVKIVLASVAVAGLVASSAVAAPLAEKRKPASGPDCKPQITVVLKGTLKGTPGASATALSVQVTSGNRWGRTYVNAAQPTSIKVDTKTKVRRQGKKTLDALRDGDRLLIHARVCRADLNNDATQALTASKVIAHPATAEKSQKDDKDEKDNDDNDD